MLPVDSSLLPFLAQEGKGVVQPLREAITAAYRRDEAGAIRYLLAQTAADPALQNAGQALARRLIVSMRNKRRHASGVDALMHEFSLSSEEGIALMCIAEALLRIPDAQTADRLIADKIGAGDWHRHLGASPSLFVNAASWGLLLTGKLVGKTSEHHLGHALTQLIEKGGAPLIRQGMDMAMRMLGKQFVAGRTIEEALERGRELEAHGYRHSFDMLGEAAMTAADAAIYYQSYVTAIHAIGKAGQGRGIRNGPGISVKLSALHPRYVRTQRTRVMQELLPRLKNLILLAKQYEIGINIDAEETDRLDLSLDLLETLAFDAELAGFDGIGFVVQAYQKRATYVIDYLIDLARRSDRKFMVRLVKGAYWDSEIKHTQVEGLADYPVYTHKAYTDLSYLVCAHKLLNANAVLYPQFATHNAATLAAIYSKARTLRITDYEFQCLHGMGEALYDQVVGSDKLDVPCRIYAPVGSHQTLLAYLVRRLLENGANSSFVNRIVDPDVAIESLLRDPAELAAELGGKPHPAIVLPPNLYGKARRNSAGIDLSDEQTLRALAQALQAFEQRQWHATPLPVSAASAAPIARHDPADHGKQTGTVREASAGDIAHALTLAVAGADLWQARTPQQRTAVLLRAADLFEQCSAELIALIIREAGRTIPNAIGELREAVDFLRYYSAQIMADSAAKALGPVVCISPWNFPLSIFIGQVSAALAAGNSVLAKPAEQTPLIAFRATQLLHQAGVPENVLLFVPGRGETVGAQLLADTRVRGVLFTGSTQVAQSISRTLAARTIAEGREIALIAETGGQNALIVDSSALCEQVVRDVLASAFDSAGQRCSALRVLCLQEEIAEATLAMLHGSLQELRIGCPSLLSTDIGPVIDQEAQQNLHAYLEQLRATSKNVMQLPLPAATASGTFVAPAIVEIRRIAELQREVFGPILHVLRYRRDDLPQLLADINATGFGLTLGVHSRIDETINLVIERAQAGNIYVNRNIIGAVVGVQPFGGSGLSGTGPKAGGPLYLKRLQRKAGAVLDYPALNGKIDRTRQAIEPALTALLLWCEAHDQQLAALCRRYADDSLLGIALHLPGPTGETNTLRFTARGSVLCMADSTPALLNQLTAALSTGNLIVLLQPTAAHLPSDLPPQVHACIRLVERHQDVNELALALYEGSTIDMLASLAAREGAIVPTLRTREGETIALWRLVNERTICINTTAAGGNASLMTLKD